MTPEAFIHRIMKREYAMNHCGGMYGRDLGEGDVAENRERPQYKKRANGAYARVKKMGQKRRNQNG